MTKVRVIADFETSGNDIYTTRKAEGVFNALDGVDVVKIIQVIEIHPGPPPLVNCPRVDCGLNELGVTTPRDAIFCPKCKAAVGLTSTTV